MPAWVGLDLINPGLDLDLGLGGYQDPGLGRPGPGQSGPGPGPGPGPAWDLKTRSSSCHTALRRLGEMNSNAHGLDV
ncbi:hypothetical protein WR25_22713 [Diploscapter pachys]|uniref:Uncharacterized protein n=1 Tax=Diploscapter pachys TaxID=2018661 RepID=A0A2A2M0R2_9BILA|nr:hypothetical protein WR25_22713 [Diploscapter pachys]